MSNIINIDLHFEYEPEKKKLKAVASNDFNTDEQQAVFAGDLEKDMFTKLTFDYLNKVYDEFISAIENENS